MNVKTIISKAAAVGLIASAALFASGSVALNPSGPTHYFLTPMAKVNPPNHWVIGLHELSYALPGNLQLQLSLIDNIGKVAGGLKYGLADNLAVGGGFAGSVINMGHHGPGSPARVGAFLTYAFEEHDSRGMAVTPHIQIGSRISVGADFGFMVKPVDMWSFIGELGVSVDTHESAVYLFGIGGLRISPPTVPFLFVDFGVKTNEFRAVQNPFVEARLFIDVMVCFVP